MKGLYRKARAGEIKDFTGVSVPYEAPASPDLEIRSGSRRIDERLNDLLGYVGRRFSAGPSKVRSIA